MCSRRDRIISRGGGGGEGGGGGGRGSGFREEMFYTKSV